MTGGGGMRGIESLAARMTPVVARLREAGADSPELVERLLAMGSRIEYLPAKTVLQTQDDPVRRPRYMVAGWACRFRYLSDGRRQIFSLLLPGDGVGVCLRANPLANAGTMALTSVECVDAADLVQPSVLQDLPELAKALQTSADAEERRMLDHTVRLGRMTALERTAHLLLELYDRLEAVGLADDSRFDFPVTQEALADTLGLSVVHMNRTLQELRRQAVVRRDHRDTWVFDQVGLRRLTDYEPRKDVPLPAVQPRTAG